MLYNYVALVFFVILGLLIPLSFLLTAKLLAHRVPGNSVKNAPWESAEETTGSSRDIDNEYMPYFMLFLPFELVLVMLILWSSASRGFSYDTSLAILSLAVISAVFSLVGYRFASDKNG